MLEIGYERRQEVCNVEGESQSGSDSEGEVSDQMANHGVEVEFLEKHESEIESRELGTKYAEKWEKESDENNEMDDSKAQELGGWRDNGKEGYDDSVSRIQTVFHSDKDDVQKGKAVVNQIGELKF